MYFLHRRFVLPVYQESDTAKSKWGNNQRHRHHRDLQTRWTRWTRQTRKIWTIIKTSSRENFWKTCHLQRPKEDAPQLFRSQLLQLVANQRGWRGTHWEEKWLRFTNGQEGLILKGRKKQLQLLWKEQRQMRTQPVQYLILKFSVNLHDVRYL